MNRTSHRRIVAGLALLLAIALGASAMVQTVVDREMIPYREAPEAIWIPSERAAKAMSLGNEALLADIYWTRAVQYYGSRLRDHKTDFSQLGPLLDITVTLDPHLTVAYYFGAFFLSGESPTGAGAPGKAVELLQRGIQANPDEWRLWHHLGFIYYWELQDYEKAAAAYREGAKNPNARDWMKVMAAAISEKGGNRETSYFLWSEIYNSTQDPSIRRNALGHLQGMKAGQDISGLRNLVGAFHGHNGRWPASFRELIAAGSLHGVPSDPAGFPYRLSGNGQVSLDPKSTVRLDYDRSPAPPPPDRASLPTP